MNLSELIEQLELIKQDHPDAAQLDVRINDLDTLADHLRADPDQNFVEIECFRPFALNQSNPAE
jgi:hypothetical protein